MLAELLFDTQIAEIHRIKIFLRIFIRMPPAGILTGYDLVTQRRFFLAFYRSPLASLMSASVFLIYCLSIYSPRLSVLPIFVLPLQSIYTDYDIRPVVFKRLLIKVRTQDYSSLYEYKKRGRPPKDHSMARPKKKEPQTEIERLQAENLRLRAENALLKKVKTLVEEQKAQALRSEQKPSTN